jgi:hypothetical protein
LHFPLLASADRLRQQCDDDREGNPGGWLEVIDAASCLVLYFFFLAPFFEDESAALM